MPAIQKYIMKISASGSLCTQAALAIPIINAPITAPGMLPKPPIITTAKLSITTATLIPTWTDIKGAVNEPARAAKKAPTKKI